MMYRLVHHWGFNTTPLKYAYGPVVTNNPLYNTGTQTGMQTQQLKTLYTPQFPFSLL